MELFVIENFAHESAKRRRRTRRGTDVRYRAAEDVAEYRRQQQFTRTYDPAAGTLRAGTGDAAQAITLKASRLRTQAARYPGRRSSQ